MNPYGALILATILLQYGLGALAGALNLKALDERLPGEFEGVYDAEAYAKSQRYTRDSTRFSFLSDTLSTAAFLAFWLAGGFAALDQWVRSWGWGAIGSGLLFIGLLGFGSALLALPFRIYGIFVLEERYGFNRTTWKTFVADLAKGSALAVALGGPLVAGILAFFEFAGPLAWLYCWLAVTVWTLVLQFLAPTLIVPLFNRLEPLEDSALRQAILAYAEKVGFPLQNILVMDGSKRSSHSNAFFMGFGRRKRIALFDTLIEQQSVPDLVAVLAHEVGHYKKKHILKNTVISIAHMGALFWLLSIFLNHEGLFLAFGIDQPSVYAGLVLFAFLYSPVEFVFSILIQQISRKDEFEADEFAAQTGQAEAMASALKKLARDNLSNLTPHPLQVFLYHSHPPTLKRIRRLVGD